MVLRRLPPFVLAVLLVAGLPGVAAGQADGGCRRLGGVLVCEEDDAGGGGGGGTVTAPPNAVWYVYYNTTEGCYATGWQVPGASLGYDGWLVLTRTTFPILMAMLSWMSGGTFTWGDFDADGDGRWDGGEASSAANALFGAFDAQVCAAPPTDEPWVLGFIETLDFTAGDVTTAPPGDPVAGWPAYVTLEPDYAPLEATGAVVVTDPDGSTSVRWDLENPNSGNTITVTADPVYRVYWDWSGDRDLYTESHRGDLTWPAEGEGELTHVYRDAGPRDVVGQVRWQVEWTTPVASGTEEFVRETPHQWDVGEYQAVVDGR